MRSLVITRNSRGLFFQSLSTYSIPGQRRLPWSTQCWVSGKYQTHDHEKEGEDHFNSGVSMGKKKARKTKIPEIKRWVDKWGYQITLWVLSHDTIQSQSQEVLEVPLCHTSFAFRSTYSRTWMKNVSGDEGYAPIACIAVIILLWGLLRTHWARTNL